MLGAANKVAQHRLGDLKVGDDPFLHRTDRDDGAWGAPQHLFGVAAYRENLFSTSGVLLDGHH